MPRYYFFKSKVFAVVPWPNTNLALGKFCLPQLEFLRDTMGLLTVSNWCAVPFATVHRELLFDDAGNALHQRAFVTPVGTLQNAWECACVSAAETISEIYLSCSKRDLIEPVSPLSN